MPTFGTPSPAAGLDIVHTTDPRALERYHRQLQIDRIAVPEELDAISELSEKTQVYIYCVGAWPQQLSLGSLGSRWIPALDENKVLLHGDLSVSEPLVVTGIPSEPYPADDGGRRIYHKPQHQDPLRKHTGYHLALEMIGAASKSKADNDLRPFGVFVSLQPEQKRPGKNADPAQLKAFAKWESDVNEARKALAKKYAEMCARATAAWKNGKFQVDFMNDDRIFMVARILNKTKVDCPWLENTVAAVENKSCIAECGFILPVNAIICGNCHQKQVTDEKYDAEIKRRLAAVN